jgi:VanZ family protein
MDPRDVGANTAASVGMVSSGSAPVRADLSRLDILLWVLTALSAGLTLVFSIGLRPPGVDGFRHADKMWHGLAYFTTSLLFLFAAVWRPGRGAGPFPHGGIVFALLGSAAGGVVEVVQGFTATRDPSLIDWVAEVVGILAALGVVVALRARAGAMPDAR